MVRSDVRTILSAMAVCGALLAPLSTSAQDIADIDYEHLSFRGVGLEFGYVWPNRVEPTQSYTLRFDLGYAGPGLRVAPSLTYWKSRLEGDEIAEFESSVLDLIAQQNGGARPIFDLGVIDYTDIVIGVDAHVVWELPFDVLTFGGFGVAAHVIDGDGEVISGTFVEDLFDSVDPGFNLHVGTEYPVTETLRVYGSARYEVMPDLHYAQIRGGLQFMFGPNAPGEGRNDR